MNKPFSLVVQETEQKLVEIINKSGLPIFCLKKILENIFNKLNEIEIKEINKYQDQKKQKKESEK